jgi:hypothetical protein
VGNRPYTKSRAAALLAENGIVLQKAYAKRRRELSAPFCIPKIRSLDLFQNNLLSVKDHANGIVLLQIHFFPHLRGDHDATKPVHIFFRNRTAAESGYTEYTLKSLKGGIDVTEIVLRLNVKRALLMPYVEFTVRAETVFYFLSEKALEIGAVCSL